jgi:hypothetical protein
MNQPTLFDAGECVPRTSVLARNLPANYPAQSVPTPAPPGTGPAGETCKTCAFYRRVRWQAGVHLKCERIKKRWTHGLGTDIKANWPACAEWQAVEIGGGK